MDKMKIVIVDDITSLRRHFINIITKDPEIEVIGEASSGVEAVGVVLKAKPDIVLMDIQMETEYAGIRAIETIKEIMPEIKIIVFTIHEEDEVLFSAYAAGVNDYILKTAKPLQIITSIKKVYRNQLNLRPDIAEKLLGEFARIKNEKSTLLYTLNIMTKLTNSEFEILRSAYKGYSYKEIAKERFVEEGTIKKQANMILKKFEMSRIKDVVRLLGELKIFDIYPS